MWRLGNGSYLLFVGLALDPRSRVGRNAASGLLAFCVRVDLSIAPIATRHEQKAY